MVTFGPDRITATYKGMVPFGKVLQPRDVTVLIHTENPDEIVEFQVAALEMDEGNHRSMGRIVEDRPFVELTDGRFGAVPFDGHWDGLSTVRKAQGNG